MAFSPDSRFLASGSQSGKINLFGVDTGKKESCLDTRGKLQLSIAYVSLDNVLEGKTSKLRYCGVGRRN